LVTCQNYWIALISEDLSRASSEP